MKNALVSLVAGAVIAVLILLTVRAAADPQPAGLPMIAQASTETSTAEHPYRPLFSETMIAQADLPLDAGAAPAVTTPADAGSGSATPAPTQPSDALANPVDDPIEAYSDLKAAKRLGWAPFLLAIVVMLTAAFARAGQKWPAVKPLAWVAKKKWALLAISGAGLVAAASYNALALGGSAYAALLAAGTAVLALIRPTTPTSETSA